jgi:hypothetical protein
MPKKTRRKGGVGEVDQLQPKKEREGESEFADKKSWFTFSSPFKSTSDDLKSVKILKEITDKIKPILEKYDSDEKISTSIKLGGHRKRSRVRKRR